MNQNNINSENDKEQKITKAEIFRPDFYWVIFGPTEIGKTTMMISILTDPKIQLFKTFQPRDIYIVSPRVKVNPETGKKQVMDKSYDPFTDILDKDKDFDPEKNYLGESEFKHVNKIIKLNCDNNSYLRMKGIENHTLFILDDCCIDLDLDQKSCYLAKMSTQNRHENLSVIILAQDYVQIAKNIRTNVKNVSVFNLENKDNIKTFVLEKRGKIPKDEFEEMYWYCCSKPRRFFHYFRKDGQTYYFDSLKEQIYI